jgi:hypothetical protein
VARGRTSLALEHRKALALRLWALITERYGSYEQFKLQTKEELLPVESAIRNWMPPAKRLYEAADGSTVSEEEWKKVRGHDVPSLLKVAGLFGVSIDRLLGRPPHLIAGEALAPALSRHVYDDLVRRRPDRLYVGDIADFLGASVAGDVTGPDPAVGVPIFPNPAQLLKAVCDWADTQVAERAAADNARERDAVQDRVVALLLRLSALTPERQASVKAQLSAAHADPLAIAHQRSVRSAEEEILAAEADAEERRPADVARSRLIGLDTSQASPDSRDAMQEFVAELLPDVPKLARYRDAPFTVRQAERRLAFASRHPQDAEAIEFLYELDAALYAIGQVDEFERQLRDEGVIVATDSTAVNRELRLRRAREVSERRAVGQREFRGAEAAERDGKGSAELEDARRRASEMTKRKQRLKDGKAGAHGYYATKDRAGNVKLEPERRRENATVTEERRQRR